MRRIITAAALLAAGPAWATDPIPGGVTIGQGTVGGTPSIQVLDKPGGQYVRVMDVDPVAHTVKARPSLIDGIPIGVTTPALGHFSTVTANSALLTSLGANTGYVGQPFGASAPPSGLPSSVVGLWTIQPKTAFTQNPAPTLSDGYDTMFRRDTTGLSGGTVGFVNTATMGQCAYGAADLTYEWCGLDAIYNFANGGENVARYMQATKYGTGATWAAVMDAIDPQNTNNPPQPGSLLSFEADVEAAGTDANGTRIGGLFVFEPPTNYPIPSGGWKTPEMYAGIQMVSGLYDGVTSVKLDNGIIFSNLTMQTGIECRPSTYSTGCIAMGDNQAIFMDSAQNHKIVYDPASGGSWNFETTTGGPSGTFASQFSIGSSGQVQAATSIVAPTGVFTGGLRVPFASPAANSVCAPGNIAVDATYIYTCVATNTWHRVSNGTGGY